MTQMLTETGKKEFLKFIGITFVAVAGISVTLIATSQSYWLIITSAAAFVIGVALKVYHDHVAEKRPPVVIDFIVIS